MNALQSSVKCSREAAQSLFTDACAHVRSSFDWMNEMKKEARKWREEKREWYEKRRAVCNAKTEITQETCLQAAEQVNYERQKRERRCDIPLLKRAMTSWRDGDDDNNNNSDSDGTATATATAMGR
ncbi:unnamed protein product [Acanthocheilonema viteae]|uniref:Uncharacterized protein n=1 Tax=Acanthocheilonema viteae TaxID=6277 RepID=A0A498SA16_ACAVI|nr:unnamed protein product [Acanthocheilonema viteae]